MDANKKSPFFQDGFWWWYDPTRKGWFAGCAPEVGTPAWAETKVPKEYLPTDGKLDCTFF